MKKLKLDLGDLKVESFETNPNLEKKTGTVNGFNTLTNDSCDGEACQETQYTCLNTCQNTCQITCDASCGGTCDNSCYGGCEITGGGTTKYCCDV